MSENSRVTRAAGVVGAATLLSRIFGFARDVVIAWFFGAGLSADAFFVAFRIPNLLRRLFAEGSLTIAFIPVFTDYMTHHGKDEAFHLARAALRMLSLILICVSVLGVLFAPLIVRIVAPGFADSPEKLSLTVFLTRIMFPYVFFICLAALCMGILNVFRHFAAPAIAPVLLNIAMILSVFLISPYTDKPVTGLAAGVIIGGILQLALQFPFLIKKGFYFWQKAGIYHSGLKKIGILMLPAVFGATVHQINIIVGTLLASLLPQGSVSYLYYADRLVEFPLGIFAISIATAILPSLSQQASAKDFNALRHTFSYAMKLVFFITIPSMVGLIVLREPIIALLFKRGAFDSQTTRLTAEALLYYSIGLWAFSGVRIVVSTFYALQDTKTPVKIAFVSVIANIVLGILLMGPMLHGGLAVATALASMLNFGLLVYALRRRIGALEWREIVNSVCKSLICALMMGVAVQALAFLIIPSKDGSIIGFFSGLMVSIVAGCGFYVFFAFLLRSRELDDVLKMIRR